MIINFVFDKIENDIPVSNIFDAPSYKNLWPREDLIPYSAEWGTVVYDQLRFLSAGEIETEHVVNFIELDAMLDGPADLNIYPILIYRNGLQYPWQINHLSRKVVDLVNRDLLKILLVNSFEVVRENYDCYLYKVFLKDLADDQRITKYENIITACTDFLLPSKWANDRVTVHPFSGKFDDPLPNFKCLDLNGWMPTTKNLIKKYHPEVETIDYIEEYIGNSNKPFTYLLMNNRPTNPRFLTYKELEFNNLLEYGLISINQKDNVRNYDEWPIEDEPLRTFVEDNPNIDIRKLPEDKAWDEPLNAGIYMHQNWINNTYFSIINETRVNPISAQITEKVYKLFYYGHPFIVYGATGMLKQIRNLGFKTFPELFDESYDEMPDGLNKVKFIIDQVKQYCSPKGKQRLIDLLPTIRETLRHNRAHFLAQDQNDIWARIKEL